MTRFTSLDGGTVTQLRGLTWFALSDTAYRLTIGGSADGGGGFVEAWGTAGTTPARIDPLSGREAVIGARIDENSTHVITMPVSSDADFTDRWQIAGELYEVTAVRERTRGQVRRVEVTKHNA